MVDEFQDISPIQYELIREWNKNGKELFVIGDPDQSIYGFRGSDSGCFAKMQREYPETRQISLEYNYRSTGHILNSALAVIGNNPGMERKLKPWKEEGIPYVVRGREGFLENPLVQGTISFFCSLSEPEHPAYREEAVKKTVESGRQPDFIRHL